MTPPNTKLNAVDTNKSTKKSTAQALFNKVANLSLRISSVLLCLGMSQACQATAAPEVLLTSPVTSHILQAADASSIASASYPKPLDNQVIHVLKVAQLVEPSKYQLQVQIGLTIMQDCNQSKLMGEIQQLALPVEPNQLADMEQGAASYYWLESLMQAPMVTMPCINPKIATFVPLGDTIVIGPEALSENVFYLPQHAQLRYRLWRANEDWSYSH
ncbi:ecotin family protein [Shewanella sp.]|uniref:ecotin family protein n=1 Tax=Shewanella sp. TaxID=50422 RepID=UPI0040548AC0